MDEKFFDDKYDRLDNLTDLYNRDVIVEYVGKLISENKKFALIIIDLDNFKYINDGFGHLFGDHVLKQYADALRKIFKERGVLGRYGGDEFFGVLEDVEEYDDLWRFLHEILGTPNLLEDKKLRDMGLTCTIGSSRFPKDATKIDDLFELADKALYRGKMKGRNCFIIYLPEKHAHINLKTERDKVVSSMYLHSKVFNALSRTKNVATTIKETINFLGNYFMIDHLCLMDDKKLYCEYFHPLCKKHNHRVYDNSEIEKIINTNTGICNVNSIVQDMFTLSPVLKEMVNDGVYAIVYAKIAIYGKTFGYVRADCYENPRGRVWQSIDMDVLLNLAHILALELYYQHLELDELSEE